MQPFAPLYPTWHNKPALDTPITAAALQQLQDKLVEVTNELIALEAANLATYLAPSGGADHTAIAATFPRGLLSNGSFQVNSGVTIAQPSIVAGLGGSDLKHTGHVTELVTNSPGVSAITLNAQASSIRDLALRNTATTPTTGAAIEVPVSGTHGDGCKYRDISIQGFYDGLRLSGEQYKLDNILIQNVVNDAIVIDAVNPDYSEAHISDIVAFAGPTRDARWALNWKGGGGVHIENFKTNGTTPGHTWQDVLHFNLGAAAGTGEFIIADSVLDCFNRRGVSIECDTGESLGGFYFNNVYIKDAGGGDYGYYINGGAGGGVDEVHIRGGGIRLPTDATHAVYVQDVVLFSMLDVPIVGVTQGNALVTLGNVTSCKLRMGNVSPATNTLTYTAGTVVRLFESDHVGSLYDYNFGNGSVEGEFAWKLPAITSTTTWVDVWEIDVGGFGGCMAEFMTGFVKDGVAAAGISMQTRLITGNDGGAPVITTILTDADNPASMVDIQWTNPSIGIVRVQMRKHSGSTVPTPIGGWSKLTLKGAVKSLTAFN